jgi:hypothetical protein
MRQRCNADVGNCRRLVGAFAIIALAGCSQPRGPSHDWADGPRTTGDAYSRQVDLDVLLIVAGMALAHGGRVVTLVPDLSGD